MAIKLRVKELIAVKERKENRKLTTRIIAEETGLNRGTVMSYINNTVTRLDIPILEIWRDYLGVPTSALFVDQTEIGDEESPEWMAAHPVPELG